MNYKLYLIATIILVIAPLTIIIIPKYLFYINIIAILVIINGFMNIDKYIFLVILLALLFRFIFMDKNKSKNKKGLVEHFDDESEHEDFYQDDQEDMTETGVEEFLIKDKFSQLHDIIHEFQNTLERDKISKEKLALEKKTLDKKSLDK
jgi:hypothetical protein